MKVKQHTLLSFEFKLDSEDKESLSSYLDKNRDLLKNHLLVFNEKLPENIEEMLKEKSICYLNRENCSLNMRKKRVLPFEVDIDSLIEENREKSESEETPSQTFGSMLTSEFRGAIHRPIRSGELIETDKDIVVLSRMNSGSEIRSSGNVEIFGVVDGRVECNGSYMILSRIGDKGSVIFNGIILDKALFRTKQPKIVKLSVDGKVKIEELA